MLTKNRTVVAVILFLSMMLSLSAADTRIFLVLGQQSLIDTGLPASFEEAYHKDNPREKIEVVSCVAGESSIKRWMPGGDLFVEAVRCARLAETNGQIVGILWQHGDRDAKNAEDAKAYWYRLESVVKGFRNELGYPVPFVAGGPEGVAAAVKRVMETLPRCAFVPSNRYYQAWNSIANRLVGKYVSQDYSLLVGGRATEVIATPFSESWKAPGRQVTVQPIGRYSYATFPLSAETVVEVSSETLDLAKTVILPESQKVEPLHATKTALAFKMRPGQKLVLEPTGRERALVLAANPIRGEEPKCGSPKLRYFGPGYHRSGFIELGDDEGAYLAEGAWVEGLIYARGRNITISGPGVISGAPFNWRGGPPKFRAERGVTRTGAVVTMCGESLTLRDVTIYSGWVYHLALNEVTNAVIDNVKIIGGRNINDDGIDPCRTKDLVIRNSFVRTHDDCIAPKYWIENLLVEDCVLWNDCANAIRIGFECEDGKTGLKFSNIVMRDIDVLHVTRINRGLTNYWTRGVVAVEAARGQAFENLLFENLRVYECPEDWVFADVRTRDITAGGLPHCHTDEAGFINGLIFRNIHLEKNGRGMLVGFSAHDPQHPIRGVRFENVTGYGPVVRKGEVDFKVNP